MRPIATGGCSPDGRAASTGAGLAYEVEGLTKVEVTSLSQARSLLASCRARRRRLAASDSRDGAEARIDAFACEWWLETVTEMTSGAFGVRSRVSRSARSRVVDVYGDGAAGAKHAPAFALAQCVTRLARAETDEKLGVAAGHGDWRQSALTKLSKAPLTGEGLVSVLVTLKSASAETESAETALRFAGAARGRRNGFRGGGARVERAVETSRRERLESKLAATRAEARRGGARGW